MNALSLSFENQPITVLTDEHGSPWWFADEVCTALGLEDHRQSTRYLDEDEKGVSTKHTLGGTQQKTTINESGLYSLILRSRKPEAKRFKKWVTSEVLPSIRRTGQYTAPSASPQVSMPDLAQMTAAMTQMMAPFIQAQVGVVRELTELVFKLKQTAPSPAAEELRPLPLSPKAEAGRKGGLKCKDQPRIGGRFASKKTVEAAPPSTDRANAVQMELASPQGTKS